MTPKYYNPPNITILPNITITSKDVTLNSRIARKDKFESNFGVTTWHPPAINTAKNEDIPPIWHKGAVCKYT